MNRVLVSFFVLFLMSCTQEKIHLLVDTAHQINQNAKMKEATQPLLTDRDVKDFTGLEYFEFN